jgi:hypothetical protein
MDSVTASYKYPAYNKPTEVYTNQEATVNIAIRRTSQLISKDQIYAEGKKMETQMLKSGRIQLIRSEPANKKTRHVFSFYTSALDTKVYNIMFVFSVKGRMVIGSFNCTSDLQPIWGKMAYEIIHSVKEI